MNRIAGVETFTRKDDPTFKAKTKENVKGYTAVPQSQFMKIYKGDGEGKNEERLANYFETGFVEGRENAHCIDLKVVKAARRGILAMVSGLWYTRPNYNTMEDRSRKEVFGMHMNEDEIPFTEGDLPEKFFEDTKSASPAERVIPTVPYFVAADRPSSGKMINPEYKELCLISQPGPIDRTIEEDWIDDCCFSEQHQHCYYLTWEHREKAQLNVEGKWRNRNAAMEYYNKLKGAQKRYQKIDLSTSLMFFRRMTPQNDVFKQHRCEAIVEVFKDMTAQQIVERIVFEGQQHVTAVAGITPGTYQGVQCDDSIRAMEIVKRGQSQMQGSADRILATDICRSLRIISRDARQAATFYMDGKFREDHNLRRRFLGHRPTDGQWKKFLQNVECQDAF
eukprot:6490585-Amphidinium_carterae.1